jgi:peptidoglycan/xylan/chitin deacetylase (PgdA/CDA1 family)
MRRAAAALAALLLSGCAPALHQLGPRLGRPVDGAALPRGVVVLTYDDGPDEDTLAIARWLHDQDPPIRATFFVNGRRFCRVVGDDGRCLAPPDTRPCDDGETQAPVAQPIYYPESLLDELVKLGHHIANHSQDHCHLPHERAANLVWEIATTQALIDRHGAAPFLFRAPYLEWGRKQAAWAHDAPELARLRGPIDADLDGEDWDCWPKHLSIEQCGARYLALLRARRQHNGIVLMHDRPEFAVGSDGPLRLTRWLVERLRAEGYRFGSLDSLPVR